MKKTHVASLILAMSLMAVPWFVSSTSSAGVYDPWYDLDDDGDIDIYDVVPMAGSYGATGTPVNKTALLYNVSETFTDLEAELAALRLRVSELEDYSQGFINPPAYDSGWVDITNKSGQYFTLTHNLNSTDIIFNIQGEKTLNSGEHQICIGGTSYMQGWNKRINYQGTSSDIAYSLVQTDDGGFAIAGYVYIANGGFTLVKTDATGDVEWMKELPSGVGLDRPQSLIQASDGGYTVAGYTSSFGAGGYDFYLVKTDAAGTAQWTKTYGGTSDDGAHSVIQTSDGGYALAGDTSSLGTSSDFWLVKTDASGNMQWNKTYGGISTDYAYSVVQASDGGYVLAGYTYSFGAGGYDFWLVKTDASGNMQWSRTYGGISTDCAYSVVQASDGGYVLAGHTYSFGAGSTDFWLVKTDASGNMQWSKTYGGTSLDYARSLVQASDGGYVLAGYTYSFGAGGYDFWLVKTDASGNMQWNKTYGGTSDDYAYSLVQTVDGGYALGGNTYSFGAEASDFWLVKADAEIGLALSDSSADAITLYRGATDVNWNYVRVRIWKLHETP